MKKVKNVEGDEIKRLVGSTKNNFLDRSIAPEKYASDSSLTTNLSQNDRSS